MKKRLTIVTIAISVPAITIAAILVWFWMLATPAAENIPQLLSPTKTEPGAWSYRVNGESVQPHWSSEGYFEGLPADGEWAEAEASMVVTEPDSLGDYLYFLTNGYALTVTLDGDVLYADDMTADFSDRFQTLYVNLPAQRAGKTLTLFIAGPVFDGYVFPCFPNYTNQKGFYAGYISGDVRPIALSAAAAVAAVMIATLFVFGLRRGAADWRVLLLLLFALAYMMASSAATFAMDNHFSEENASVFLQWFDLPQRLYLDILLIFFALYMKRMHKIILCAGVALHAAWTCFLFTQGCLLILEALQTAPYMLLLLASLVLMLAEYKNKRLFRIVLWATIPLLLFFAVSVISALRGDLSEWVLPAQAALFGNWLPLSIIFSVYLMFISCIGMLVDFLHRQMENQVLLRNATVQAQYAIQNASNLEDAIDRSREARHEYRHHLEALLGLCREGNVKRVEHYVNKLFQADNASPTLIYTENALVNALVSSCAIRCRERQINFNASIQVPEQLNIEDTDLAVLLTNLLENALEAVSSMPEDNRWIRLKLGVYSDMGLFVGCENTFLENRLKESGGELLSSKTAPGHGFGFRAMRQIAQKYNSVLRTTHADGVFHVQTCLALPKTEKN